MYNARGTYQNQTKFSTAKENNLLQLLKLRTEDTIMIEKMVQNKLNKLKNTKSQGFVRKAIKGLTRLTSNKFDDLIFDATAALIDDKKRSNLLSSQGINTSKLKYLKTKGDEISRRVKDALRESTEDMKASNSLKSMGLDIIISEVMKSDEFKDATEKYKDKFDSFKEKFNPLNVFKGGENFPMFEDVEGFDVFSDEYLQNPEGFKSDSLFKSFMGEAGDYLSDPTSYIDKTTQQNMPEDATAALVRFLQQNQLDLKGRE
tara:strand:+ start:268 stop:1047 length:780 start_codon:yes stop_codon:yes gene_type:complete